MQPHTDALFERIDSGRVSQGIVAQIKDLIREGQLRPGDRLPPERQLSDAFGVSRVTVRDALRILEAAELVDIRVGAGGGAFIRTPSPDLMADGLANLLAVRTISAEELTEARELIELGLIPVVCARATEDDLADLEQICSESLESLAGVSGYDIGLSAAFHVRLAQASHNTAIAFVVESLHGPLKESLAVAQATAPEMGRRGTEEHLKIVSAIRDRDADRARRILHEHVERTRGRVREGLSRHVTSRP